MPTLHIRAAGSPDRSFRWTEGCIGIGRHPVNQVVLDAEAVSRWHAAILEEAPG